MARAARFGDSIKQDSPHCHAPIHPTVPPTPSAHPAVPLKIVQACAPTVYIDNQQAAVVGSVSAPCNLPSCVPAGPGVIARGSATVFHCGLAAARVDDGTAHPACTAPIPAPVGKVLPPGSPFVDIGG
jgi:hypothetical protein